MPLGTYWLLTKECEYPAISYSDLNPSPPSPVATFQPLSLFACGTTSLTSSLATSRMCYHIVAACSICGARADWCTLIKPCNDRAQGLGPANLALLDTFLRFYNTGELGPCPNDQLVHLR